MSELKIPDAAWRAAEAGANEVWKDYIDIAPAYKTQEGAIRAAAPLIVAAELRRQVSVTEDRASDASYKSTEEVTEALLNEARHLRARADELDPQGVTK